MGMREVIPVQYHDEITVRNPTLGHIDSDVVLKVYGHDEGSEIVSYLTKSQAKAVIRALKSAIKEAK